MKVKTVFFFANGSVAAFDQAGAQIPDLQENAICQWAEHATKNGYDVTDVVVETTQGKWKLAMAEGKWVLH